MKSKGARNLRRKINARIRAFNKNIENDDVWLGRFVARQRQLFINQYGDHSGYYAHMVIRISDKKTGRYRDALFSDLEITMSGWKFFEFVNNFIIEDCKVWHEEPDPWQKPRTSYVGKSWKDTEPVNHWPVRLSGKRYM